MMQVAGEAVADTPLAGGVAVVTGAGSGIGRAIAHALGREGMRLVLLGRAVGRLEAVAAELGADARVVAADLAREADVDIAIRAMPPAIRVLVHSAGLFRHGTTGDTAGPDWAALSAVNLHAPMRLTAGCLGALRAARGQVVFINSTAGLRAGTGTGAYAASKHALRAAADALRAEVNGEGIRVLSVFPGRTDTPMQAEVLRAEGRTTKPDTLLEPEDVAAMVLAALRLPARAEVSELTIRPSRPG